MGPGGHAGRPGPCAGGARQANGLGYSRGPRHRDPQLANPDDDSITGYAILRRDKDLQPEEGTFFTVTSDTGTAATTYTDDTVEPDKRYVYRIKAINANGMSEISSWARGYTPVGIGPGRALRRGQVTSSRGGKAQFPTALPTWAASERAQSTCAYVEKPSQRRCSRPRIHRAKVWRDCV